LRCCKPGVYVPILTGLSAFKDALRGGDTDALLSLGMGLVLPVGLGVVIGVAVVSLLLKWLLARYSRPTLGVLLGLLLGAVVGLMPFQESVKPVPGGTIDRQVIFMDVEGVVRLKNADDNPPLMLKGQQVGLDASGEPIFLGSGKPVEYKDYPTRYFEPSALQLAGSLGLILLGFGLTLAVDRIGNQPAPSNSSEEKQA